MSTFLIDHSIRQAFKSCPRKVYFQAVAAVQPIRPGKALMVGSAFHRGLEHWRALGGQEPEMSVMEAVSQLSRDMLTAGLSHEIIEDECSKLSGYLLGYFKCYVGDVPSLKRWHFEIRVETSEEHGTFDAMFEDDDGKVWIVDDKTRSEFSDDQPAALRLEEQMLNYGLLVAARGWDFGGVIWRETLKTLVRRKKKEELAEFQDRILAEYLGPSANRFYRETRVSFTQEELDNYRDEKAVIDERIRLMMQESDLKKYHRNSATCIGPYGSCEFLKLCTGNEYAADYYKPSDRYEARDGSRFQKTLWPEVSSETGANSDHGSGAGNGAGERPAGYPLRSRLPSGPGGASDSAD